MISNMFKASNHQGKIELTLLRLGLILGPLLIIGGFTYGGLGPGGSCIFGLILPGFAPPLGRLWAPVCLSYVDPLAPFVCSASSPSKSNQFTGSSFAYKYKFISP